MRAFALLSVLVIAGCATTPPPALPGDAFLATLRTQCGATFVVERATFAIPGDRREGMRLEAKVAGCSPDTVRVEETADGAPSTTHEFRRGDAGLVYTFHQHHGTAAKPVTVTVSGEATADGTALSQDFTIDAASIARYGLPAHNAWGFSLLAEGRTLVLSQPGRGDGTTRELLRYTRIAHPTVTGDAFLATLRTLCGAEFVGESVFPTDPNDAFRGKRLVATFAVCTEDQVRVPFQVGDDRSRTWVFRATPTDLELKHDHRHPDGTPDALTDYGGSATAGGSALAQSFAADAHTAALIPAARTNVWTISVSPDGQALTYALTRDGKPRFEARLTRTPPTR